MQPSLISTGIAAADGVALHYVDDQLVHIVSSRPDAGAYRVHRESGEAREETLPASYLGAAGGRPNPDPSAWSALDG